MPVYYVTHPNIDFSATVYAPSTEKARTTYLDYLERRGMMRRSLRQRLREDMVAEKVSDAEGIESEVTLHYGYEAEPIPRYTLEQKDKASFDAIASRYDTGPPEATDEEFIGVEESSPYHEEEEGEEEVEPQDAIAESDRRSPIARASTRGYM